jgi:probable addiction module antidote protein
MQTRTFGFDSAELLDTPEAQAEYLSLALAEGDVAVIADALGTVARARGMTRVAEEAGLGRESLYKALSSAGNPEFATVLRVLRALDMRLAVQPATAE